jgi:hypothetical protein
MELSYMDSAFSTDKANFDPIVQGKKLFTRSALTGDTKAYRKSGFHPGTPKFSGNDALL